MRWERVSRAILLLTVLLAIAMSGALPREVTVQLIRPLFLVSALAGLGMTGGLSVFWLTFIGWAAASRAWSFQPGWSDYQLVVLIGSMSIYLQARTLPPARIREVWFGLATASLVLIPGMLMGPGGVLFPGAPNILACALLISGIMALQTAPFLSIPLFVAVIATGSRGAIGSALIVGLCWTIYHKGRAWVWPAAGVALAAIVARLGSGLVEPAARWEHWYPALQVWENNVWTGGGLFSRMPHWAHNDFLQVQSDLGLVGLGLFVLLLVAALMNLPKRTPWPAMAVAAVIIHSTVSFPLQVPGTAALFWLAMGTRGDR